MTSTDVPSTSSSGIQIKLLSTEGETVLVDSATAEKSRMLSDMLKNLDISDPSDPRLEEPVAVPARINILQGIISWCGDNLNTPSRQKLDEQDPDSEVILTAADQKFCNSIDGRAMCDLLHVANFLDIPEFIDIGTQYVTNQLKGKSAEQMRYILMLDEDQNSSKVIEEDDKRQKRIRCEESDPSSAK